tara:strand:- start:1924 stop:2070 length:147 start_codon:yes stop_codon:yes gene_type:complete
MTLVLVCVGVCVVGLILEVINLAKRLEETRDHRDKLIREVGRLREAEE